MRRVMAMVATTILVLSGGCGSKSYEYRLDRTLESMRYRKRLDDNLMPPPAKGIAPFEELSIFLRPPKNLAQSKEFQMTVLEPGQFDLESSFFEEKMQNLHVLARVKKPKRPASKKPAAPTPADTAVPRRVQPRCRQHRRQRLRGRRRPGSREIQGGIEEGEQVQVPHVRDERQERPGLSLQIRPLRGGPDLRLSEFGAGEPGVEDQSRPGIVRGRPQGQEQVRRVPGRRGPGRRRDDGRRTGTGLLSGPAFIVRTAPGGGPAVPPSGRTPARP